jgi:hypothetical protein
MAPSWRKHFDELVDGPQMLPPGVKLLGQFVEEMALFKHICFH